MKYKYYTMAHQLLYEKLKSSNEQNPLIEKEQEITFRKHKEIRTDYGILSKQENIDAIFSDIMFFYKKKLFMFEHIIIKGGSLFILERSKHSKNQIKSLKAKSSILKKLLSTNCEIKWYILENKQRKTDRNHISIEGFKNCKTSNKTIENFKEICDFFERNHIELELDEYMSAKYSNRAKITGNGKGTLSNLMHSSLKYRTSMLSSIILFVFTLNTMLVYYKIIQFENMYFTFINDLFFLAVLYFILPIFESMYDKKVTFGCLAAFLSGVVYVFLKNIYYF